MIRKISALALFVLGVWAPAAQACAVCFGNPDKLQAKAITGAVLFLLVVTLVLLSVIGGLLITWTRRAHRLAQTSGR